MSAAALARAASLTAGLLLLSNNSKDDPGYQGEWDLDRKMHHLPPPDKDKARLAALEAQHAQGTLTAEEEAELIALLAKVKGIRVQKLSDLVVEGPLYGTPVRLPGFHNIALSYTKRPDADREALRRKFRPVREKFVKDLAADPSKTARLKQAGLTDNDLKVMTGGKLPDGWEVHHKLPLDDGGDNSVHNLLLIKKNPFHSALTNYQNAATAKMKAGDMRMLKWPTHDGYVYP